MKNIVNIGDEIEILYTGKLKDGTIFDSTKDIGSFKFTVGSPDIIKGMSDAVIGMKLQDKRTVNIPFINAYGDYNPELLIKIPRDKVPQDIKVGNVLTDSGQEGRHWWVREVTDEAAILDGNHPLSGQDLIFEIEIVSIV
ncbi:MAG: FKBP-type peptidyl-prolyl cis-trans isomerase [Candidatus Babeliales bacterium]|nr:FKBP-type peptidyl-prolyl cis-trans isomerase [Candidatus Babeliales bacterium]